MCKQTVIFSDNLITTFNQLATQYAPLRPRFVAGGLYSRSGPSKFIGEREALDLAAAQELDLGPLLAVEQELAADVLRAVLGVAAVAEACVRGGVV